jgi:hypothetical protein
VLLYIAPVEARASANGFDDDMMAPQSRKSVFDPMVPYRTSLAVEASAPVAAINVAMLGILAVSGDDPAGKRCAIPDVVVDEDACSEPAASSRADIVEAAMVGVAVFVDVCCVDDAVESAELWLPPAENAEIAWEAAVSKERNVARNEFIDAEVLLDRAPATVR